MFRVIRAYKLAFTAGLMTLLMLGTTVFNSYGQYEDPPSTYWVDRVIPGSGEGGCYTTIILNCAFGFQRVFCQFNGVYGPPYECTWTRCYIGYGTRTCVKG